MQKEGKPGGGRRARRATQRLDVAPPGLCYEPDVLGEAHERALLARLETLDFAEVHMHGVVARRRVLHFGWTYGYQTWKLAPAPPLPAWLEPLREEAARLTGEPPQRLSQILVTRYPPGAGIGWHRDAPMFGPAVVGFSLAASCSLRLRRTQGEERREYRVTLEPRSAYVLAGPARSHWQHAIPPHGSLRYSVTFRSVIHEARWRVEPG